VARFIAVQRYHTLAMAIRLQPSPNRGIQISESGAMNGLVKWFHPQKGLGFIECSDGCRVLFRVSDSSTARFRMRGTRSSSSLMISDY
jgi:hypothetical protein